METEFLEYICLVLSQAASVHLWRAGALGWIDVPEHLHQDLAADADCPETSRERARECLEALGSVRHLMSDRPVVVSIR